MYEMKTWIVYIVLETSEIDRICIYEYFFYQLCYVRVMCSMINMCYLVHTYVKNEILWMNKKKSIDRTDIIIKKTTNFFLVVSWFSINCVYSPRHTKIENSSKKKNFKVFDDWLIFAFHWIRLTEISWLI